MWGPGRAGRVVLAGLGSVGVNAGILLALSASSTATPAPAAAGPRVPVSVRRAPPPPPPPEPTEAEVAPTPAAPAAAPLPRLELPSTSAGASPLALPKGEGRDLGWKLEVELPGLGGDADALATAAGDEVTPPQMLYYPELTRFYPRRATRMRTEGRTVLELDIDTRGRVREARVLVSEPAGVFEQAAVRAAKEIRYRPARRGGRAQNHTTKVELTWRTDG